MPGGLRRVVAVAALVVSACTSSGELNTEPTGDMVPSATPAGGIVTSTTAGPLALCPNPHGGACLGALDSGTYSTSVFDPRITFTVPSGWENLEDLPGNFLLQQAQDPRYLFIARNVRAPAECEEAWAAGVGGTVGDLVDWYTSHPGLVTSEPQDVTVGGLAGVYLDISLDPGWTVTCPYSDGLPVVPIIIGDGTSQVHHVMLPGFEERLYLLEWKGGNVAIEVGPEGASLEDYLARCDPDHREPSLRVLGLTRHEPVS